MLHLGLIMMSYIKQITAELTMCVYCIPPLAWKHYSETGHNVRGQGTRRQGGDMQDRQEEKVRQWWKGGYSQ